MVKQKKNYIQFSTKLTVCAVVALFFFSCKKQEMLLAIKPIYTVTFNSKGGSEIKAVKVKHGDTVTLPANPVKNNAAFGGWYAKSKARITPFSASTAITADLTLYAEWKVFTLSSASFTNGGNIPPKYASPDYYNHDYVYPYQGKVGYLNVSPQLSWKNVPPGTTSFFVIMENISIPDFPHWIVFNIPAQKTSLAENESLFLLEESIEYRGVWSYEGKACAYQITIFALNLSDNYFIHAYYVPKSKKEAEKEFKGHILASAFITGKFISEPVGKIKSVKFVKLF